MCVWGGGVGKQHHSVVMIEILFSSGSMKSKHSTPTYFPRNIVS